MSMEAIKISAMVHRGKECMTLEFSVSPKIQQALRRTGIVKWSKTHRCWYAELSRENYLCITTAMSGLATIDNVAISEYLLAKKQQPAAAGAARIPAAGNDVKPGGERKPGERLIPEWRAVGRINRQVLADMRQQLLLKAYSPHTIKTYLNEMSQLLLMLGDVPANRLQPEHLKRYLVYCYEKLELSENTLHSRINAMKFYYEQVLGRDKFFREIPRPKKRQQLPGVFSKEEIALIIKAAGNMKHKVMLMLSYAAGLRISEVVKLKVTDIDSRRKCILIKQAKGKKDRMAGLSPVLLVMLREYYTMYRPDPKGYLFAGQETNAPYSTRSLQLVLAAAKRKAGVLKPGSIHALRHSFATHLLEKGTDVVMIQKLLGHTNIKTTLQYLHVTNRDLLQVISPLDDLKLDE